MRSAEAQAAELPLPALLEEEDDDFADEPAGAEDDDEDVELLASDDDEDEDEDSVDFAADAVAGVLLDDEPRLSLR